MLKGITVVLYTKTQTGVDGFNFPIYEEVGIPVDNVLVSPASSTDLVVNTDLEGKKGVYTLGIPKGDAHDWEDAVVEFFGHKFKTFGYVEEGIEAMVPLAWHKKIMCERYE